MSHRLTLYFCFCKDAGASSSRCVLLYGQSFAPPSLLNRRQSITIPDESKVSFFGQCSNMQLIPLKKFITTDVF